MSAIQRSLRAFGSEGRSTRSASRHSTPANVLVRCLRPSVEPRCRGASAVPRCTDRQECQARVAAAPEYQGSRRHGIFLAGSATEEFSRWTRSNYGFNTLSRYWRADGGPPGMTGGGSEYMTFLTWSPRNAELRASPVRLSKLRERHMASGDSGKVTDVLLNCARVLAVSLCACGHFLPQRSGIRSARDSQRAVGSPSNSILVVDDGLHDVGLSRRGATRHLGLRHPLPIGVLRQDRRVPRPRR